MKDKRKQSNRSNLENNSTNILWKEMAQQLKGNGVTEEEFLRWWDNKYPLMEKEYTDDLIYRLFHLFK
ncbi:MAG: hypothetical protein LUH63_14665 [Parabacteroides sp.]|nr:hypothetical protein [Parabacteroides sp.]